jgi:hypothetical protein
MFRFFALVLRLIGLILLLAGFAVLGYDLLAWRESGAFAATGLGQLWTALDPAGAEAYAGSLSPLLLELWSAPILAVLGIVLLWAFRRRRRRIYY